MKNFEDRARGGAVVFLALAACLAAGVARADDVPASSWAKVVEDDRAIKIETEQIEAVIPKNSPKQWMTGIEKGTFLDKATGFREVGDGLMVVDWLMEPGSDAEWADEVFAPDGNGVGRYSWFENGKTPEERREILSRECADQTASRLKPADPKYVTHAESMMRICKEYTSRP